MATPAIHTDPEILNGTPVFRGTRVPIQNLFDYLQGGEDIDEFLDDFPSVSKGLALEVLQLAETLVTSLKSPTRGDSPLAK